MKLLVVTPTLGRSPYLDATRESVRATAAQVELQHVLVCPSGDVPKLAQAYPDCTVIADGGPEEGMYGAINRGWRHGQDWDWFTYINDDDVLGSGFAPMAAEHIAWGQKTCVAYGNICNLDTQGRSLGRQTVEKNSAWFLPLMRKGISVFSQQGTLCSRQVVEQLNGFDASYRLAGDLDFWIRAWMAGVQFRHYQMEVGGFRIQPGQISGDRELGLRERERSILAAGLPDVPAWKQQAATWRFRLCNGLRYVERLRSAGWKTSAQLIGQQEKQGSPS